jgi:RNA polymerase sigma-70 factor (ECF subfamily)
MCRMVVIDIRRGIRRREGLLAAYGDTPEAADAPEPLLDSDKLAGCLEALAERERAVLVHTFFDDQPADAVASALALRAGHVRVIRHRALVRMRDCMGVELA